MAKKTEVQDVNDLIQDGNTEVVKKDANPVEIFDPRAELKGNDILKIGESSTPDIEKFKIIERAVTEDMITAAALAGGITKDLALVDPSGVMKALDQKHKFHKNYLECVLARQKAELEAFDKIRENMVVHLVAQIQQKVEKVLDESSMSSELKVTLKQKLTSELSTIELDAELKKK